MDEYNSSLVANFLQYITSQTQETTPAESLEDVQINPDLQRLLSSYMTPSLALTVCSKWNDYAESYPQRMKPIRVDTLTFYYDNFILNLCDIVIQKSDVDETGNGRIFRTQTFANIALTDIHKPLRFLYVNHLNMNDARGLQLEVILESLPPWWRESVKTVEMKVDIDRYRQVTFVESFPNLDSLFLSAPDSFYRTKAMPFIVAMTSVKNFTTPRYTVTSDTDDVLNLVCSKSNCLEELCIPGIFTAKAIINLVENGSFADVARLSFYKLNGTRRGIEDLTHIIATSKGYHQIILGGTFAKFKFRKTRFKITFVAI